MFAYIRGILAEKEPTRVVVEAAGVGYELLIPLSTYERQGRVGEETKLLCEHIVREDEELLFGFATASERELFRKLVSVSGVGPKIALAILSGSSVNELSLAIVSGDAKRLSAIKGVGKKTAEKICIELKDKVDAIAAMGQLSGGKVSDQQMPGVRDAVSALRALGFNEETSSKLVAEVLAKNPQVRDVEQIIKLALSAR